jgi:hypothetical protein
VVLLGADLLDWREPACHCITLGRQASGLEAGRQEKGSTNNGGFFHCGGELRVLPLPAASSLLRAIPLAAEDIVRVCI